MMELIEKLKKSEYKGKILKDEPLKNHTTMKVGGNAELFLFPETTDSLVQAVKIARDSDKRFFLLGGGSNVIFSDSGFDGIVVSTEEINGIQEISDFADGDSPELECLCGTSTSKISDYCQEKGFGGFEAFSGLPGSVGGAVFMNARCYDDEISCHVRKVEYFDLESGKICNYLFDANDWSYKVSPFQDGKKIVLKAFLGGLKKLEENSVERKESRKKASEFVKNREAKGHFKYPSAGSVFKNNRSFGKPSGVLIDEAGLKGLNAGDAQVAPWHGNFIINNGNATSSDLKRLVEIVQKKVKDNTGFELEPEVIFVE